MRRLLLGALLAGTSFFTTVASAQELQPNEIQMSLNGAQYGCLPDPSSWRAATPAHDALVDQGYSTSLWLAGHPGFAPFSDQYYFLCRAIEADPVEDPG